MRQAQKYFEEAAPFARRYRVMLHGYAGGLWIYPAVDRETLRFDNWLGKTKDCAADPQDLGRA